MSDNETNQVPNDDKAYRESLKNRADLMGIKYPNNVSNDRLAAMIQDALEGKKDPEKEPAKENTARKVNPREAIRRNAMKLVRVRITCHNPNKQQLEGEIFTVANEYIGTVSRYVPFGSKSENGTHIEQCIYDHLVGRKYLHIDSREDKHTKRIRTITKDAKEFSVEVLPPLTKEELTALRNDQRIRGAIEE